MSIYVLKPAPPTIPDDVADALDSMAPRVFLRWNKEYKRSPTVIPDGRHPWEGRWEIWSELTWSRHPDAQNEIAKGDLYNPEAGCWMRFLQTYENEDGTFAPADWRLIVGLRMADAWAQDHFYEEHVEKSYQAKQDAGKQKLREAAGARARYYYGLDNPIVGPHSDRADWRHRIR